MAANDSPNVQPLNFVQLLAETESKTNSSSSGDVASSSSRPDTVPIYASINFKEKHERRRQRERAGLKQPPDVQGSEGVSSCSAESQFERWRFETVGEYEEIVEIRTTFETSTLTTFTSIVSDSEADDDEHIYEPINVRPIASNKPVTYPQIGFVRRYFTRTKAAAKQRTQPDERTNAPSRLVTEFRKLWPTNGPHNGSRKSLKSRLNRMCRRREPSSAVDGTNENNNSVRCEKAPLAEATSSADHHQPASKRPHMAAARHSPQPIDRDHILDARTKFLQSCLLEDIQPRRSALFKRPFFQQELSKMLASREPAEK